MKSIPATTNSNQNVNQTTETKVKCAWICEETKISQIFIKNISLLQVESYVSVVQQNQNQQPAQHSQKGSGWLLH